MAFAEVARVALLLQRETRMESLEFARWENAADSLLSWKIARSSWELRQTPVQRDPTWAGIFSTSIEVWKLESPPEQRTPSAEALTLNTIRGLASAQARPVSCA